MSDADDGSQVQSLNELREVVSEDFPILDLGFLASSMSALIEANCPTWIQVVQRLIPHPRVEARRVCEDDRGRFIAQFGIPFEVRYFGGSELEPVFDGSCATRGAQADLLKDRFLDCA